MPGYETDTECLVKRNVSGTCKSIIEDLDLSEDLCKQKCVEISSCSFFVSKIKEDSISCKICIHGSIRNSDDNVETAGFCPKVRDNLAIPIPPNPNPQLTKFWCQKGHNDTIGRFPLKYEEVIYTEPVMEENKQWCGIRDSPNILTSFLKSLGSPSSLKAVLSLLTMGGW